MKITRIPFILSVLVALQGTIVACPNCYGAPGSPLTDGMNTAILIMLGITGFVFGLFIVFFVMLRKRSRLFSGHPSDKAFVNEKGVLQWNIF
ncbi:MAG: hypothetical protein HY033_01130 [Ignavibacteriae bacterium]|nr:hypothetical protein [Ignavibacteria bacterium]MBI3363492.1 hypothetical protein [Ignavibacteriota bacterium]